MNSKIGRFAAAPLGRDFWGELVWALAGFPPTLVCVVVPVVLLGVGFGLFPLGFGALLVTGVLLTLRKVGGAHRRAVRVLLSADVAEPPPPRLEPGLWNWVKARIGDRVAWRVLGYLLIRLPLSLLNFSIAAALLLYGLGCLTYPLYWNATGGSLLPIVDVVMPGWLMTLPFAALGAVLLLGLPPALRVLTSMDRVLAGNLLGSTTLRERVRDLEESRATVLDDATTRLRRIERDLHDGAQAQLVALAMKLGMARDEFENGEADLALVRKLVSTAHGDAKQALTELRDLARGIRPPALDAGLEVALTTLAARSAVDVRLRVDLPDRLSPAMETLLYFSAAELLTNAVKHAGAPIVHVEVLAAGKEVRLRVSDEGTGGAWAAPGGGLAGVAERVGTVDGRLDVESPPGGPTVITAHIPTGG